MCSPDPNAERRTDGGQTTQFLSPPVTKWNLDLQLFWGTGATQKFGNNGNLYRQMIQTCTGANLATPSNFLQTYTYDGVNRLAKVNDSGGANSSARTFSYDQFGNMWSKNTAGSFPSNMGTPTATSNFNHSNNRLTTTTYDAAGNQLGIPAVCSNCLQYDAENRLVAYTPSGTTYTYDGNGQRVQKIANGVTITYVYDAFGKLAEEFTSWNYPTRPCTTCYLSSDHLGSTRMVTDQNGALVSLHDYLPFGEEIISGDAGRPSVNGAQDNTDQKFTGQLRDSESNLDYFNARYFAAALGRFTSPDPANAGADPTNPQSWNAYVYNNPLALTDPTGMFASANPYPTSGDDGGENDPGLCDLFCYSGGFYPGGFGVQSYSGPITQGGGSGGGNNYTTTLPPRSSPPKTGTRPCANVDPKNLDYITPRLYRSENRAVSAAIHIKEGHIQPVNDPKNSYYLFGNPITGISDPMATMAQVVMINRATFSWGTPAVQQNTNVSFKLAFPPISIDIGFGILSRYGIGKSRSGNWLSTNTLIIDKNCTGVVTSFPSNP